MSRADIIYRLILAMIIGGIVGIEREKSNQWAGFRTHVLVAVGSCVAAMTSLLLFNDYKDVINLDPGRIPAQVLSGIGFLGAGAILKTQSSVRGLTTAAGIWVIACVGLAIGYGYYYLSFMVLIFLFITLYTLRKIEKIIVIKKTSDFYVYTSNISETLSRIVQILEKNKIIIKNMQILESESCEKIWAINITVVYSDKISIKKILKKILDSEYVVKVDYIE
ncbi:putative Mg2+ transporter-C (MgtC) family protein [Alkalithermobacter thermoalcaliphilus JW-YL-7 = DSM 7308]|uniref:Mg2+ transporter-C (MgtC) family protein n=1 Tax=Alkalithermobacter thermoalcaliphilus JW-YL-7 = DSM 7308 TaxID=1121328 RepID=A0A150FRW0_CLOPD|nr:MgtC/SapB transporter [[Clostridium] paradoxum JW-YL-7 = DSM 7308]SHK38207.1 putative Mg2+ transporter-C (MgtC) family protein [[Clostridium] paradoxum JW-YL-7 = DSM 7308]